MTTTEPKIKVLLIDDDKFIHRFVRRAIQDDYEMLSAFNGEEGLQAAHQHLPDIVLLDIEMAGINGYEVCDKLKCSDDTKEIPVMFLSAHSSLRERLQGYEMGGCDFIVKPFVQEELLAKLNVISSLQGTQDDLKNSVNTANQVAFQAMQGNSELGRIISFVEQTCQIMDFDKLAQCLIDWLKSFGMRCCVHLHSENQSLFFSAHSEGSVKPLEKELITMLADIEERFYDFGCRTQINYPNTSVLVKNMPLNNRDAYGRYKDMLPYIVSAVDTQFKNIVTQKAMLLQTQQISSSFKSVNDTLLHINDQLHDNENQCIKIMKNMMADLEKHLPTLGLEDDQEHFLIHLVDNSYSDLAQAIDSSSSTRNAYAVIARHLQQIGDNQQQITEQIEKLHSHHETVHHNDNMDNSVELF